MPAETNVEKTLRLNREHHERNKEKDGVEGVFARLCLIVSPNAIAAWMEGEITRGSANLMECEQALAQVMAYHVVGLAMTAPQVPPGEVLTNVLVMASDMAGRMAAGYGDVPVVQRHVDSGAEMEGSLADILDSRTATKN